MHELHDLEDVSLLPRRERQTQAALGQSHPGWTWAATAELALFVALPVVGPLAVVVGGIPTLVLCVIAMFRGSVGWREALQLVFGMLFALGSCACAVAFVVGVANWGDDAAVSAVEVIAPLVVYLLSGWMHFLVGRQLFVSPEARTRTVGWDALSSPHSTFHTLYKLWTCASDRPMWNDKDSFLHADTLSSDTVSVRYGVDSYSDSSYDYGSSYSEEEEEAGTLGLLGSTADSGSDSSVEAASPEAQLTKTSNHFLRLVYRSAGATSFGNLVSYVVLPAILAVLQACVPGWRRAGMGGSFATTDSDSDAVVFVCAMFGTIVCGMFLVAYIVRTLRELALATYAATTFANMYSASSRVLQLEERTWRFSPLSEATTVLWRSVRNSLRADAQLAAGNVAASLSISILALVLMTVVNTLTLTGAGTTGVDNDWMFGAVSMFDILVTFIFVGYAHVLASRLRSLTHTESAWVASEGDSDISASTHHYAVSVFGTPISQASRNVTVILAIIGVTATLMRL